MASATSTIAAKPACSKLQQILRFALVGELGK
jgi:hypothetical protein